MLGLVFLKYVSDAFTERHQWLTEQTQDADSEYYMPDEESRELIVRIAR